MHRGFLTTAALLGALAVVFGALGSHQLPKVTTKGVIDVFEIGVRYQFIHTFALLAVGILFIQFPNAFIKWAGRSFLLGMLFFCGSIYALTLINISGGIPTRSLQLLTPTGGIFLVLAWILLMLGILIKRKDKISRPL